MTDASRQSTATCCSKLACGECSTPVTSDHLQQEVTLSDPTTNNQHKTQQSAGNVLCRVTGTSARLHVSQSAVDRHRPYRDDELRQYAGDRLSWRPAVSPRGISNAEQLCDVDVDVCVRARELRRHRELEALLCEQSVGTGGPDSRRDQKGTRRGSERR